MGGGFVGQRGLQPAQGAYWAKRWKVPTISRTVPEAWPPQKGSAFLCWRPGNPAATSQFSEGLFCRGLPGATAPQALLNQDISAKPHVASVERELQAQHSDLPQPMPPPTAPPGCVPLLASCQPTAGQLQAAARPPSGSGLGWAAGPRATLGSNRRRSILAEA